MGQFKRLFFITLICLGITSCKDYNSEKLIYMDPNVSIIQINDSLISIVPITAFNGGIQIINVNSIKNHYDHSQDYTKQQQ